MLDATIRKIMLKTIEDHPEVIDVMKEAVIGYCNGTINTAEEYEKAIAPALDIVNNVILEEEANAKDNDNAADQ